MDTFIKKGGLFKRAFHLKINFQLYSFFSAKSIKGKTIKKR